MKNWLYRLPGLVVALVALTWPAAGVAAGAATDVRVMSYNVRVGTAPDGVNAWDKRKTFLAATIAAFDPDLLGTQETLGFQRDYLASLLPGYDSLGVGRDDGRDGGEMMALFYRRDRFEKLDSGYFWLSQTPDVPGSKGWDAAFPRMVTWVRLRDRRAPGARPLFLLDTHLDNAGATARVEAARLIRQRLGVLAKGCDIVITGDFNSGEDDPPHAVLFDPAAVPPLVDSYRRAHPVRAPHDGTFTGFDASARDSARIDWIAVSPQWQVVAASIDRAAHDGRTPSDHFGVTAVLRRGGSIAAPPPGTPH